MSTELYEAKLRCQILAGHQHYHLEVFGDYLAKREGYKEHDGLSAVHYYLMCKHGWLPSQVRSLSWDDLQFALAEDMSGWTVPEEAVFALRNTV